MIHKTAAALRLFLVALALVAVPSAALAQGALAGVVTDETGGVLPGVTVEASSPALIEQVRAVATNGDGAYRIADLRPGLYTVTFTLPGFQVYIRNGILLEGSAVVTVNGDMRLGSLEESITVTGESAIVDVQSSTKEQVLTEELLNAIPTGRQVWNVGYTLPGVTLNNPGRVVGGAGGIQQVRMGVHGANHNETTIMIDGMAVNANHGNGSTQQYFNQNMAQEMSFSTSGNSAELQKGGVALNMIPQTGGNTFGGTFLAVAVPTEAWVSDNFTGTGLKEAGLRTPNATLSTSDYNASLGGPIKRDVAWFYGSFRRVASDATLADSTFLDGSRIVDPQWVKQGSVRLTAQLAGTSKITGFFERTRKFRGVSNAAAGDSFEATRRRPADGRYYDMGQVKWTSTVGSRVLLEAGYSFSRQNWSLEYQEGVSKTRDSAEWFASASRQDLILGTRKVAPVSEFATDNTRNVVSSSVSYVTGSHALKTGVQHNFGPRKNDLTTNADLNQRYRNGVPDSVVVYNTPNLNEVSMDADLGIYVQDSWRLDRLTINAGLRYDYFKATVLANSLPAGRFAPARTFPQVDLPTFNDLSPRFGATYDLFGDGTTAVKAGVNKYVASMAADFARTYDPAVSSTDTRTWNDLNGDDIAQDNEIGPSNNSRFGVAATRRPDDNLKREYNVEYNASIDRQLTSSLSVSAGYYRRTFHRLWFTDNTLITAADYLPVEVASPLNGEALTVWNLDPAKRGLVDRVDTNAPDGARKQIYNGVEFTFQARTPGNGRILGGITYDRTRIANCSPDDPNVNGGRFCNQFGSNVDIPFRTMFKLSGFYPLPVWGIEVSGSLQSAPGALTGNDWSVSRKVVPGLTQPTVTVPLVAPGTRYLDQINQLDISFAKAIAFNGNNRLRVKLELFNAFNSNVVLGARRVFGSRLDSPTEIMSARMIQLGASFNF
ncbi:MAG: carboxypeptidase regulatory-like domain-containing protein [Acidobacteria bacterium]|nr:carboxypeptidase regulatory-like domain-containing protein [Acidobacteriota bacterium]